MTGGLSSPTGSRCPGCDRAGLISAIVNERDPRRRHRELRALLDDARAGGRDFTRVAIVEQRVSIDLSHMGQVLESRPLMSMGA